MFRKIDTRIIRQRDPALKRDWYASDKTDVLVDRSRGTWEILWFETDRERAPDERACVRWDRAAGIRTGLVDTGETGDAQDFKRAPVVIPDRELDVDRLDAARRQLREGGLEIPAKLLD